MTNSLKLSKKDIVANFFAKYKKYFKILAILLVIFVIFSILFSIINNNLEEKYSKIFHQALIAEEIGDFENAKKNLLEIYSAKIAPSNIKSLAGFRYAGLLMLQGNKNEALKIYEEIAFNVFNDDFIQELSGLFAAKILVNDISQNSDEPTKNKTLSFVKKVVKNNKFLKNYTNEQLAIFYIKIDKKQDARKILEEIIKSKNSSKSLKDRALKMTQLT